MIHSFDSSVAEAVGVKGAILLNHIHWWVEKNKANEMNHHDGCYWTYNSAKAYSTLFPYWTSKTIQRELQKLEYEGYIKTGCYNNKSTNRTKWYTLTNKGYALIDKEKDNLSDSIGQKCPMDWSKMSNGLDKNGFSSINSNKTYSNKHSNKGEDDKTCSPELAEALNAFAEHRKKLKKPMTDYAKKLLLNKLQKLAKTEQEQIAIINQSIENGWQGIFPLGGERKQKQAKQSAADMAEDVIRMMDERGMLDDTRGANENDTNAGGVPSWFSE
jgi:DNA-binding MarR family transcriptional regulator